MTPDTPRRMTRVAAYALCTDGELRVEVGGSSDACAWVRRVDVAQLPLVELAEVGIGLAFGTP